jgi:hypothetical protein
LGEIRAQLQSLRRIVQAQADLVAFDGSDPPTGDRLAGPQPAGGLTLRLQQSRSPLFAQERAYQLDRDALGRQFAHGVTLGDERAA